jgi:hypothetical protein
MHSYGLDERGSIPGKGKTFFSTPQSPDGLLAHQVSYPRGARGCFLGHGREADHSYPPSAEVKNGVA